MVRQDFVQQMEDLTGYKVISIEWIYGLGGNVGDSQPLYYFEVCLQVRFYGGYVQLLAGSYCKDRGNVLGTMLDGLEIRGSELGNLSLRTDSDEVVSLLSEYMYNYGDTKDKPEEDTVYFESM